MPLKNHFAKKETIKISKLHPREQEVPAFWLLELHYCYCRDLSLSCMCFCWGLCMYCVHKISHRQKNMRRQFDLGAVPDHFFCSWDCCVTKLSCLAARGLLQSQELWLMETSQKASAGQTCFSQSIDMERQKTIQYKSQRRNTHHPSFISFGPLEKKSTELSCETDLMALCAIN